MTDEAPPEPVSELPRCPSCLAPIEPGQEYCLECGARLPAADHAGERRFRAPLWIALAAVLLLLGGFGIAWGFTRDSSSKAAASGTHTGPPTASTIPGPTSSVFPTSGSIPSITGTSTVTATTTVTSPSSSSSSSTTSSGDCGGEPAGADDDSWPNGVNGWAAILSSKPVDTYTFADFCERLHKAQNEGFTNLGILDSTNYGSLQPGYWVLYQGPFTTSQQAASAAQAAQADWPGAYPRAVNDAQ